jgi:hypothetical protein
VTFEEPVPEDIDDGDPRGKPEGIDVERPSPARIYDYALGGAHNFAVDRQVADQVLAVYPEMQKGAYANRAFLRRAVQFLVDAGVRQFLDIGSGIPTVGHVHEIAQAAAPESRVVFVDIDPVAVAHSRDILRGNDRTAVIQEDCSPSTSRSRCSWSRCSTSSPTRTTPRASCPVSLRHWRPEATWRSRISAEMGRTIWPRANRLHNVQALSSHHGVVTR